MPRAVPTIVFHGDVDTTVHPSNSEHAFAARTVESGEASGGSYTRTLESGGPDASREMLRFFLRPG